MTEQEFHATWCREEAMYVAWGNAVVEEFQRLFEIQNENCLLDIVLKIPARPRLKTVDSMLSKAFHRAKNYSDPYLEMEDKVGVRFVVLLTREIALLQEVVKSSKLWTSSFDKDFEDDRELRPQEFSYQSMHYVVRSCGVQTVGGITVEAGTPCEIQIRTLLQHAHSELTHDNIYKREAGAPITRKVERTVARSMALIEAVDDYFDTVIKLLDDASSSEKAALDELCRFYKNNIGVTAALTKTDIFIVHAFKELIPEDLNLNLNEFINNHQSINNLIKNKRERKLLFRSPAIFLIYLMVHRFPEKTKEIWPLTSEELEPIYTDLGKRL